MFKNIFLLSILLFANSVFAAPEKEIKLEEGTKIPIIITKSLSSANSVIGQPIEAEVKDNIIVDDYIVIKKGTQVRGSISAIQKAQRLGKGGNISIQLSSVKAIDNQKITLRSVMGRNGKDKTGSTVALTVLISPLFLLKKGHEAGIRKSTEMAAFVDEDITIKTSEKPEASKEVIEPSKNKISN